MNKKEKIQWILSYIREHGDVNILDSKFHEEYILNCNPTKTDWHMLDFAIAPEIGRYLSEMYTSDLLLRNKFSMGFREAHTPSYIYNYSLKE